MIDKKKVILDHKELRNSHILPDRERKFINILVDKFNVFFKGLTPEYENINPGAFYFVKSCFSKIDNDVMIYAWQSFLLEQNKKVYKKPHSSFVIDEEMFERFSNIKMPNLKISDLKLYIKTPMVLYLPERNRAVIINSFNYFSTKFPRNKQIYAFVYKTTEIKTHVLSLGGCIPLFDIDNGDSQLNHEEYNQLSFGDMTFEEMSNTIDKTGSTLSQVSSKEDEKHHTEQTKIFHKFLVNFLLFISQKKDMVFIPEEYNDDKKTYFEINKSTKRTKQLIEYNKIPSYKFIDFQKSFRNYLYDNFKKDKNSEIKVRGHFRGDHWQWYYTGKKNTPERKKEIRYKSEYFAGNPENMSDTLIFKVIKGGDKPSIIPQ